MAERFRIGRGRERAGRGGATSAPLVLPSLFIFTFPQRSYYLGNPCAYDTFIDEGLNLALRTAADRAHAKTLHKSVYLCFEIMGRLKANVHLFAPAEPYVTIGEKRGRRDRGQTSDSFALACQPWGVPWKTIQLSIAFRERVDLFIA